MKKLLLATMIGASFAIECNAVEVEFSYVEDVDATFGYQKKESYDVAIFLPGDIFEGYKITAISGPINAQKGIANYSGGSVWLSSELKVEDKLNVPTLASYEAEIVEGTEGYGSVKLALPEIYTIPAEGVYVGYSFTVSKLDSGTRYPICLGTNGAANSFFVHTGKTVTSWTDMTSNGYSSPIVVTMDTDKLPAQSVSFTSIANPIFMSIGVDKTVPVTLTTTASEPVESVDFEFSLSGQDYTYHYDLPVAVPAGLAKNFIANVVIPAQNDKKSEIVEFKVSKVNGQPNTSNSATGSATVAVFDEIPVRTALIEEFTGTWCAWCPRGFAALEYMAHNYPEFVTAAYHNADAMQVTGSYPVSIPGFPSASIDRSIVGDPYYGTEKYDTEVPIIDEILEINSQPTEWGISVFHTWDDSDHLTANVNVTNLIGFSKGSYKIGYLLVCDGLSGEGSQWNQKNNYASYSPTFIPELNQFCKGGIYGQSTVRGLVFNDVVVSVDGYAGVAGSIPSSMEAEESISHSKTWDLSKISSDLIPDKNKLRVIAFILNGKGESLNCAKEDIKDYGGSGIDDVLSDTAKGAVEYYNLNGVKVENPSNGIFVRRQGGKTSKVVVK